MSFEHLDLLSSRALKTLCVVVGLTFLGVAAHVWFQGEIQKNGAELLILIPLLSGAIPLIGAALLEVEALRVLLLAWFVGLPALFSLVSWVGCGARWFSPSFCQ